MSRVRLAVCLSSNVLTNTQLGCELRIAHTEFIVSVALFVVNIIYGRLLALLILSGTFQKQCCDKCSTSLRGSAYEFSSSRSAVSAAAS